MVLRLPCHLHLALMLTKCDQYSHDIFLSFDSLLICFYFTFETGSDAAQANQNLPHSNSDIEFQIPLPPPSECWITDKTHRVQQSGVLYSTLKIKTSDIGKFRNFFKVGVSFKDHTQPGLSILH